MPMLRQAIIAVLLVGAWGLQHSPHSKAFLSTENHVSTDVPPAGAAMNFSPMSTTMKCILSLTLQYFVIYTALGISRSVLDFQGVAHSQSALANALKHATDTMFYAPMVCMLFLGFRMRVLQLSKGQGAPQDYVQFAMQAVTYSILANTVLVLVVPLFTTTDLETEKTGEMKIDSKTNPFESPVLQAVFNVLRYITTLGLYVGFGTVLVGLFRYMPEDTSGVDATRLAHLSPAVGCTVMLSCAFFTIYFLLAVSRTYSQVSGGSNTFQSKFELTMTRAADTLGMAPMLCALFLAARMRALQMDPVSGNPQRWAQNCFWYCSGALILQTIVSVTIPYLLNGDVKKGRMEGDMEYDVGPAESWTAKGMTAFRFIIMLSVYASATAVVCSVFTIQHPDGKEQTPPLSPTMQCVLNLSFQYFLIYGLLWVFITVEDFTSFDLAFVKDAVESAKSTVQFAPMLAVLFIATRMRALQMTDNKGSPQGWVQDGMYLATWSILIQFMMCLIMPVFTNKTYQADSLDGSQKATEAPITNYWGAMAVTILRYFALIALLGGVTAVTVGVFMMTPETANGRGAIPVIADGTIPGVNVDQPVGINDVPGAKGAMESVGSTVGSGVDAVDNAGNAVNDATVGQVTG
jgi:hypothetical protein